MGVMTGPTGVVNGLRYWRHAVVARDQFEASLPNLVTTKQAAAEVHVKPDRIRQWASRGILTRYGRVNGVAYYDLADVHRVAAAMRTGDDMNALVRRVLDEHPVTGCTDPGSD
jgi:hypothetical protein